jgi:ribosome biogenesis GTPase
LTNQVGRIIKNYNGYYYVETKEKTIFTCKIKGKLKQERFSMVTGDFVEFEDGGTEGMITAILPRKNFLQRPLMANVDVVVVTFAMVDPDFNSLLMDKLLALTAMAKISTVIALNKMDLATPSLAADLTKIYQDIGYQVINLSTVQGKGIEELRQSIAGKVAVFAGPSGVGKSTLLNCLDEKLHLNTGYVSKKIGRGRHTTKFAQLMPFGEGFIADTPGFGNINLEELAIDSLENCFREFTPLARQCKFTGCTHIHEPGCAVKAALGAGKIAPSRYESYVTMFKELAVKKERNLKK